MKIQHDKLWLTSDLHFYHKNILKYTKRPYNTVEEMNQGIIDNWNSVVKEDDIVIVLGDLGFCGITKLIPLIKQLKGQIYVIQGNHDSDSVMLALYNEGIIKGYNRLRSITVTGDSECPDQELTLCHFPMISWYNKEKGAWMIHGHEHQQPETLSFSPAHYDVGLDKNNCFPISFEQLKIAITKQYVDSKNANN